MASKATCIEFLLSQVRQATGNLAGGTVTVAAAGDATSTPITIWLDRNKATPAANPYTLDANGTAQLYADGLIKVVLKNAAGTTVYTRDNLSYVDYQTSGAYQAVDTDYASLNAAITAIGSTPTTLTIRTAAFPMTGAAVVPATLSLKVEYPGSIANGAYALTINGPLYAPLTQIFTGTGAVTGLKESYPEWFGATGDGTTDDTTALNRAIQSTNGWVKFRAGKTYICNPATTMAFAGGSTVVAFPMKSNMYLDLTGATIKVIDDFSTDSTPKWGNMFGAITALSNIVFRGGTLDWNGANNTISPSRPSSWNSYTQSFIAFSGDNGRATNVMIDGVTLQNGPGSNFIMMGQSNTVGVTLGSDWTIKNCTFINDALDTYDQSLVYAFAENVLAEGNTFKMAAAPTNGVPTAFEIHGANTTFVNNKIINFFAGLWASVNYTSDTHNVLIADNTMIVQQTGVDFEHDIAGEKDLYDIVCRNNVIEIDDTDNRGATPKYAFAITARNTIHDITISGNTILKTGGYTYPSAGLFFNSPDNAQKHTNIVFSNNHVTGTTFGFYANVNTGTGTFGYVGIKNNSFHNLQPSTGYATPYGVTVTTIAATPFDHIDITGNSFSDTISSPLASVGIALAGYQTIATVDGNTYAGYALPFYSAASLVARHRYGDDARSLYTAAPTSGIWDIGDRIPRNTPTVGQPKAWMQTTNDYAVGAYSVTRANTTAYATGVWALWTTGTTVWEVTAGGGGNTAGSPPDISGKVVGGTVVDGAITWTMRSTDKAVWTSEGNL